MKKLKQNIGVICIVVAILIFILIVKTIVEEPFNEYSAQMATRDSNIAKLENYEKQKQELEKKEAEEENQLKKFKPFYKAPANSEQNSPGLYGNMFDSIIKIAQSNGLMIRSIETDMNPSYAPLFAANSDKYFACEFKFFFIGTYAQLQSYLNDMINKFEYMMSISKLNVTAFSENPDYLLIKISFTLYAQKATPEHRGGGMFRNQNNKEE